MKTTSQKGIEFIKSHEGFIPQIYRDAYGYKTIGYGHLLKEGEEELFRNGITREKGEELLKEDLKIAEKAVNLWVNVPLNQNQFDALVSFVFNVGQGNFRKSALLKKLNEGDYEGASNEFLKWIGKPPLKGLIRRRSEERKLFLT